MKKEITQNTASIIKLEFEDKIYNIDKSKLYYFLEKTGLSFENEEQNLKETLKSFGFLHTEFLEYLEN